MSEQPQPPIHPGEILSKPSYISWLRRYVGTRRVFHIGSIGAVRDEAGRVLVMRRSDNGQWDFPGGAMELGETLVEALTREVAEETGLIVEPLRLVGLYTSPEDHNYTYPNGDQVQGWGAFFECRAVGGSLRARDGEALDLVFMPPAQIHFDSPVLNRMKADLLAGRVEAAFDPPVPVRGTTEEYFAALRPFIGHAPILLPGTAAYIHDARGHVLLQKRSDCGLWGFPGGGQNLSESAAQAIVREVREETGLHVEPVHLIGAYGDPSFSRTLPNGDQVQPVVAFFEARIMGGHLHPDPAETLELAYFPPDQLPPMLHCCRVKAGDALVARRAAVFR
jgi:8-oxo-dGTP pyrophosphatase MutT (NUDIX family)